MFRFCFDIIGVKVFVEMSQLSNKLIFVFAEDKHIIAASCADE